MNKVLFSFSRLSIISFFILALTVSAVQPAHATSSTTTAAQIAAALLTDPTRAINTAANAANRAITTFVGAPISSALAQVNMQVSMGWAAFNQATYGALNLGACEGNGQISDVICNIMDATDTLPGFITAIGYLSGLILSITALLKLKDHVINPNNTPLSDSIKRFIAGGAFFTLPLITEASQNMLTGGSTAMSRVSAYAGFAGGGGGLDAIMANLFLDIYEPMMSIIFAFGYFAGLVLIMVGISRIIKTAQDGPRGPASMGTIMTFVIAGVLFSLSTIMGTFSGSMFDTSKVATFAVLATSTGDTAVDDHILAIISTVLVFMTIIGYISFMRGFFMIKDVAEGSSQASLMAGVTHIFGGALAVNLGPLMNAVQRTLGIDTLGVMFY
jgi:hypothetical protein